MQARDGRTLAVDHVDFAEVLEEEELATIRRRQEEFEQDRNIELAEVQRLEAEAKRAYDEKERRMVQEEDRIVREKDVSEKVQARAPYMFSMTSVM